MPTANAVAAKALYDAAWMKAKQSIELRASGTEAEKLAPFVAEMVATSWDLLAEALVEGGEPTPAGAGVFILKRVVGFGSLSENDKVQCATAVLDLLLSAGATTAAAGSSAAGVLFPPAETVSIPAMLVASASLTASALKAHQQCGPLITRAVKDYPSEHELRQIRFDALKTIKGVDFTPDRSSVTASSTPTRPVSRGA